MTRLAWIRLVVVMGLCTLTASLFLLLEQFRESGSEILVNPDFMANFAGWEVDGDDGSVSTTEPGEIRLNAHDSDRIILVQQVVAAPVAKSWVRLSAWLKTENVIRGAQSWEEAQLVLIQIDTEGQPIPKQPHVAASLHGTRKWGYHDVAVRISPLAAQLNIQLRLTHVSGSFYVRQLSMTPVLERHRFSMLRAIAWLTWGAVLLWVVVPLLNTREMIPQRALFFAVLAGTVFATLLPASIVDIIGDRLPALLSSTTDVPSAHQAEGLVTRLMTSPPNEIAGVHLSIYKLGHLIAFMLLALLATADKKWALRFWEVIILGLLLACITEVLQLLLEGRKPGLKDVAIDATGLLAGLFIWKLATFLGKAFR